ncbi:hypothetical protein FACS1894166_06240 [Bacilli bacterium]|nr:hypothetical protein FACS1894166_06240 [Bacilli bacterium]
MKNWLDDINFHRHFSIEDISDFHCRFEKIHPFLDGNGRIGRLIMLRQCLAHEINPFFISNDTRGDYINALRLYHQNGSSLFLMEYCKRQQLIFATDYSEYLTTYENRYEISILSWFKSHNTLKRLNVEQIFDVKSSGAKNILKTLLKDGLIVKHGIGKNTFYTLN